MPQACVLLTSGLPPPQYVGDEHWTDLQRLRSGYGFLQKPFTADSLRSAIEQFLREPHQEAAEAAAN